MRFSIPPSAPRATCRLTASKRNAGISAAWPRSSAIPRTSDHCVRTQSKPRSNCAYLPSLTQLPNEFNIPKGISRQYSRDAQSAEKIISWSKTTMSSDDAYGSFLEQANQSTGASKTPEKPSFAYTRVVDTNVPGTLQNVEQYYTSDADEPFEPVSLKWVGEDVPSENEFKELISHNSEVSTLTGKEFDPQGQYKEVLEAVEKSTDGKSRIYRVDHGRTRAEYYVVGFDRKGQRIIGLKAKAVET